MRCSMSAAVCTYRPGMPNQIPAANAMRPPMTLSQKITGCRNYFFVTVSKASSPRPAERIIATVSVPT